MQLDALTVIGLLVTRVRFQPGSAQLSTGLQTELVFKWLGVCLRPMSTAVKAQIKSKSVPLPLCRNQGWEEIQTLCIPDLSTRLDDWSASRPGRALHPEKDPQYPEIGGWVGLRFGLDTESKGKIFCLCRGSNPGHPVSSQTLHWLSYPIYLKI
jgi:hypothetical protein